MIHRHWSIHTSTGHSPCHSYHTCFIERWRLTPFKVIVANSRPFSFVQLGDMTLQCVCVVCVLRLVAASHFARVSSEKQAAQTSLQVVVAVTCHDRISMLASYDGRIFAFSSGCYRGGLEFELISWSICGISVDQKIWNIPLRRINFHITADKPAYYGNAGTLLWKMFLNEHI